MSLIRRHARWIVLSCCLLLTWPPSASGEGSATLFAPVSPIEFRASIEWMASAYSRSLLRRTLLRAFVHEGEYLLVASSAVGVSGAPNRGDIWVYDPGLVTGPIGREAISPQPSFSCAAQRATAGNGGRGRIASRGRELAGPNNPAGYLPCYYRAPRSGIYHIALLGPSGPNSKEEGAISGRFEASGTDFGPEQRTSVTAWEVRVAKTRDATDEERGRLFTYYIAGSTGGNGRPTRLRLYTVTDRGFTYQLSVSFDPGHFVLYANQLGFLDSDGRPLYRNVLADPSLATAAQDQLYELQGGVGLAPPEYPIFFDLPYGPALEALGIPLQAEGATFSSLSFAGARGSSTTTGAGGVFEFTVAGAAEDVYRIVISRGRATSDPESRDNRVLYGFAPAAPGKVRVAWDGRDANGRLFPPGSYTAVLYQQQGEVHFPLLDVENSLSAAVFELVNPPDVNADGQGDCPPASGGCFAAFYDARGYRTANGTLVGSGVDAPLCPPNVGNPPEVLFSDPILGFDSRTTQASWGFADAGDGPTVCAATGGFGDKKGLDFWTFAVGPGLVAPVTIEEPGKGAPRLFLPLVGR